MCRTTTKQDVGYKSAKKYFTVLDIKNAEICLDPIKCNYCGSEEVTYHPTANDAYCSECGNWQEK